MKFSIITLRPPGRRIDRPVRDAAHLFNKFYHEMKYFCRIGPKTKLNPTDFGGRSRRCIVIVSKIPLFEHRVSGALLTKIGIMTKKRETARKNGKNPEKTEIKPLSKGHKMG